MHASMPQQPHQERPGVPILCSPSAEYAVVPASSTFSAINLLRNYRLLDLVTNPSHELLYPIHQSLMTTASCSYRDYGVSSEIRNRDSATFPPRTKRISLAEDSASSPSPPPPPSSASSAATSFNAPLALPAGLLRRPPTSATSELRSNSILPTIHRPAFVNVPQQFPESANFAEPEVNGARGFFVGDGGGISGGRSRRPRSEKRPIPDEQKDDKYYERRKRNNQAAKKSRDARKIREDHIALRATMLEHENAILRTQVLSLREEAQSLRRMLIEQQMPTMAARYVMDCPRPSLPSPAPSATPSRRIVASATAESSSNRSSFFSRPSSKIPTTLFT